MLTHSLSFCLGVTGFTGSDLPQCSLSAAPQWALWFWQRVQLYPLWNAFTNILCAGATGIKHRQPPGCPTSSPFTLEHFKWLQAELPETAVDSWHWKFPWSQLACKKGCLFFFCPENNVLPRHSPNASNGANERFVLTNPWKDFPLLSKGPKIYLYSECLCLTKFNSFP